MTIKRLEEKGFLQCVSVMKWSERMDLIAIGFANGDLSLFRLSCQRVWNISAPNSMCGKVTTISWRSSDGNILAVGYASYNQVSIIDINTSYCVHSLILTEEPNYLNFIHYKQQQSSKAFLLSDARIFLPPLPNIPKKLAPDMVIYHEGAVENARKVFHDSILLPEKGKAEKVIDILIIALDTMVCLYSGCMYPVCKIIKSSNIELLNFDLHVSAFGTGTGYLVHDSATKELRLDWYDVSPIFSNFDSWYTEAQEVYSYISSFLYVNSVVQTMFDNWEDALGEVQLKLSRFAAEKSSPGSVGDEFLMLLLFGKPSEELLMFLVNELTSKGCKNLRESVSNTYTILSQLIASHLLPGIRAMLFHAQNLYKLAKTDFHNSSKAESILKCLKLTGSLALKANEMLIVIERSREEFACFFKWLYAMVLKLSGEDVPPELMETSQSELPAIAQYIKSNLNETIELEDTDKGFQKRAKFKLEKIGQYFANANLKIKCFEMCSEAPNIWVELMNDPKKMVDDCQFIFEPYFENSFRQLLSIVEQTVSEHFSSTFCNNNIYLSNSIVLQENLSNANPKLVDIKSCGNSVHSCFVKKQSLVICKSTSKHSSSNFEGSTSQSSKLNDKFTAVGTEVLFVVDSRNSSGSTSCEITGVSCLEDSFCVLLEDKEWNYSHLVVLDFDALQNQFLSNASIVPDGPRRSNLCPNLPNFEEVKLHLSQTVSTNLFLFLSSVKFLFSIE